MPLINSASPSAFKRNLKTELQAGKPRNQSLAIAYRVQRTAKAAGGAITAPPFSARSEARGLERAGMIHSPVAGRTDRLPMGVRQGSYIIPADVVSGIGQGNSMSGANALSQLFKLGPGGMHMSRISGGGGRKRFAAGGSTEGGEPVDIIAAGGEFVVPPEAVAEIGGGDMKTGHDRLDDMVLHIRKSTIRTLRKLPKPKKK